MLFACVFGDSGANCIWRVELRDHHSSNYMKHLNWHYGCELASSLKKMDKVSGAGGLSRLKLSGELSGQKSRDKEFGAPCGPGMVRGLGTYFSPCFKLERCLPGLALFEQ